MASGNFTIKPPHVQMMGRPGNDTIDQRIVSGLLLSRLTFFNADQQDLGLCCVSQQPSECVQRWRSRTVTMPHPRALNSKLERFAGQMTTTWIHSVKS